MLHKYFKKLSIMILKERSYLELFVSVISQAEKLRHNRLFKLLHIFNLKTSQKKLKNSPEDPFEQLLLADKIYDNFSHLALV